ncbi:MULTISPECIES: phage major capsid protein [unclassified Caballeronia]|uniref:phage major capsid protein n=1 Tax=unclassified Caballeronia TaxID=2646786 RepID=UPI00285CBBD1|nr:MULTISPECIES: phage major capsid protein [unclassified Caballeronia]MDR5777547.1 phage major capsid protein [Caballeronia sp. LZ002]MDR5800435.1 phage major capsid protein [Caballeronia sp. LZ001]MDR5801502.1 phage major capsid protein [Caballeronia sp. LZ001]MDR5802334.1 phage major capsid protein [Caballeronia sp. LZ001]MDR5853005.1 phage major capsid protein [Caballeronia sp. LZ003]
MNINELRRERANINQQVQALAASEAGGVALSAEQHVEFASLSTKFSEITAQIERAEMAERMAAAAAVAIDPTPAAVASGGAPSVPAQPKMPEVKGAKVARMVRALAAARGDTQLASKLALERGFGEDVAMSLNTLTSSAGGVLVPTNLSSEVIELLRPKSVVRYLGARTLPLSNGNITIPRLKGGAVVGYIGADTDIPAAQPKFDDLKLTAKKLAALVPIANDLLKYAGVNPNVDQIVVSDLTSAIGSREDKAFILDDGNSNTPKGLRHWAVQTNKIAASDGSSVQKVDIDLNKVILALEGADANMITPGWIMAPRVFRFLTSLRNETGNRVYPELDKGMLKGYPVGRTTQVPIIGDPDGKPADKTNASEVYFADFGDLFIGEEDSLEIDYSKEATYKDSDGQVVSAFQRDQTLIRVIAKNDFGPRHVESIAVLIGVRWGL